MLDPISVHRGGFRAEKACVLGLADLSQRRRLSRGQVQRLARAATRHDVPILDADELIALATRSAAPIDASQRPSQRAPARLLARLRM